MKALAVVVVMIFAMAAAGCTPQVYTAKLDFPPSPLDSLPGKLPLRVGLRVTPESRDFVTTAKLGLAHWRIPLGQGLAKAARGELEQAFDEVVPVSGEPDFSRYDIVVDPRFVLEQTQWKLRIGSVRAKLALRLTAAGPEGIFFDQAVTGERTFSDKIADFPQHGALVGEGLGRLVIALHDKLAGSELLARAQRSRPSPPPAGAPLAAKTAAPARAEPSSDVDRPAYRLPERPDDYAIVVGVERYSDLPEARFAERDADAVRDHLLALGWPSRNVVDLRGDKAGYKSIEKFVETWLPKNAGPESRVLFYFSGHGAPDPKTGEAYLIPWDGDPGFLENTGYPVKRLYAKLSALKAKEVFVAMDACFSGAGGRSVLAKGARPLVMKAEAVPAPQDLTGFAAASSDQITSTLEDQGHGTFTYYFLKGLSGGAKDASGAVTAQGLHDYLKPKVQDAARRQNRDQEPVLHGRGDRELIRFR